MKLEFSWQIFKKYLNIKFHENLSSGNWVVPGGRMGVLMELEFSWQIFKKYSNIKFHENISNGNWVVPGGRMGRQADRQAHMTKLIVVFTILQTCQKLYFSSKDFKLLTQIKGKYIKKYDSFKVRNFFDGQPLWLTAPGAKKTYLCHYAKFQILYRQIQQLESY